VEGSLYSVGASAVTLSLGALRMVLMARLLLPEHFGLAALAIFFVNLAARLRDIGLDQALLHRKEAGRRVLATYFTARLGIDGISALIVAALAPFIGLAYPTFPGLTPVLFAFIGINLLNTLTTVQGTILNRSLKFKPLAWTDVLASIVMTLVGPFMAWQGWGVWSIVGEQLSGMLARAVALWLPQGAWRPRLGWDSQIARWFWRYGIQVWRGGLLNYFLDTFDDFWTGTSLGALQLGFYSRAYEFARYSRRVVATPLLSVFFPTFARLQEDRLRLSRAFFRSTSLVLRLGSWLSIVLVLSTPEAIRLVIGPRWLPMALTFQLMVLYTLLDPMALSASNLLMAAGKPEAVVRARLIQVLVFLPAVVLLAAVAGINGVAVAADLMILVGTLLLYRRIRTEVDYSPRALWLWPLVASAVTVGVVLLASPLWAPMPDWLALAVKSGLATLLYGGILWMAEREQFVTGGRMIWSLLRSRETST
jgi:PST family polysaccharide transporter